MSLSRLVGVHNALSYEVVFGLDSNRAAIVLRQNAEGVEKVRGYLNDDATRCDWHTHYWMSWNENFLSVGSGSNVGENPVISYTLEDGYHPIDAISFRSAEGSSSWIVYQIGDEPLAPGSSKSTG